MVTATTINKKERTMKKQIAIDWQKRAEALNLKLNLIGARLKELNRDTISADIAFFIAQLVEEFNLETDQMFIRPDVAELQKKFDVACSTLARVRFATGLTQLDLLSESQKLFSDLRFDLLLLAAFTLETKNG